MKTIILFFLLLIAQSSQFTVQAQDSTAILPFRDKISIGLGAGLDYGGFGYNVLFYPQKNVGLFAGIGYALAGIGVNAGIKLRLIPTKKTSESTPFLTGMYGYNAAFYVKNASEYNKLYYGYTVGAGFDYWPHPEKRSYWSFALLIPFRDSGIDAYLDHLTRYHNIVLLMKPLPVCLSISSRLIIK